MSETIAKIMGFLFVILVFSGLRALFVNWVIGFFIDWPITWGNWGISWAAIIAIRLIMPSRK